MTEPKGNEATGRRYSGLTKSFRNGLIKVHSWVYRLSNGSMGGEFAKSPVLLLTTTGRKSGKTRTVPLLYLEDGDRIVLVASNGGAVSHPTWWLNLEANPDAEIQIKGIKRRVRAEKASADEKRHFWPLLTAMYPDYQSYQEITNRDIPVVILRSIG